MDEKINVNLIIADRSYPLKINASEEEGVRIAAAEINDRIKDLRTKYDADDKQDYLAMATLQYAVENQNTISKETLDEDKINASLDEIEYILA